MPYTLLQTLNFLSRTGGWDRIHRYPNYKVQKKFTIPTRKKRLEKISPRSTNVSDRGGKLERCSLRIRRGGPLAGKKGKSLMLVFKRVNLREGGKVSVDRSVNDKDD